VGIVGCGAPPHRPQGVAARARRRGQSRPAIPSADPRQGRAVSSHRGGRGDRPAVRCRFGRAPASVRPMASGVQHATAAPGARLGDSGGALSPEPAGVSGEARAVRLWPRRLVRRVDASGWLSCRNRPIKLGHAFVHRRVALRPADHEGCFDVLFCGHIVAPSICARRHRERLPEARPGGSTGTSRAPLRQIRGRSVGARVPRVDFRDELRRANPSIISPNTCPPCVRALHRPGFVKSP
jgi:hypothetical protein